MAAKANILGLLLVSFMLGACTPEAIVPATLPPTRTVMVMGTGTGTAVPTFSPTPAPTETQTPTQTPRPTNTPHPTFTPTPISVSTPDHYIFPIWITDPDTNTLLVRTVDNRGGNLALTVFNAESNERFDILLDRIVSPSWVWRSNELFIRLFYGEFHSGSTITEAFEKLLLWK